jgi:hypothetical protein
MLQGLPYVWIPLFFTGVPLAIGRLAGHLGSKRVHRAALLVVALLACGVGVLVFGDRVTGVTLATAIVASAAVAGLLVLLPAGVFIELGYRFRSAIALSVIWLLFALPLFYYGFIVLWIAGAALSCPPGAYECSA